MGTVQVTAIHEVMAVQGVQLAPGPDGGKVLIVVGGDKIAYKFPFDSEEWKRAQQELTGGVELPSSQQLREVAAA